MAIQFAINESSLNEKPFRFNDPTVSIVFAIAKVAFHEHSTDLNVHALSIKCAEVFRPFSSVAITRGQNVLLFLGNLSAGVPLRSFRIIEGTQL